ncbi:MAG: YgcG family protein [Bacteroidetes bacterium]|jgi:uncharacterized protein|nr:YgcG family protein [Bacteroidota bacterium]MDF2453219.1 YgcG family protein [Bacteroidota bacterium]
MRFLFLFIFLLAGVVRAQDYPAKPLNYITDEADLLNDVEESALNSKLKAFEDSSSNQLFIYTAPGLNGKAIESISQDIFHEWHIGRDGKNNGILITIFSEDHKFRIHTGYGLEGILPDLLTKHIQDNDMRPLFKENRYYEGIDKGVDQLIYYSKHEFNPSDIEESPVGLFVFFYVFSAVFLLITLLLNKGLKDRPTAKKVVMILSIIFFLIPFMGAFFMLIMVFVTLSMRKDLVRGSGSGGWTSSGDSSSWSGSSDSDYSSLSSDSGFSGGGGGDSGGGGSSSDW